MKKFVIPVYVTVFAVSEKQAKFFILDMLSKMKLFFSFRLK